MTGGLPSSPIDDELQRHLILEVFREDPESLVAQAYKTKLEGTIGKRVKRSVEARNRHAVCSAEDGRSAGHTRLASYAFTASQFAHHARQSDAWTALSGCEASRIRWRVERGVIVTYETIRGWWDQFGKGFAHRIKAARQSRGQTLFQACAAVESGSAQDRH